MAMNTLIDSQTKYALQLIERENLTHNTRRFRFALPSADHVLGISVGNHIYLTTRINDNLVIRPYTPVTSPDQKGYFDLVFKVYFKSPPKFPDGGKMTLFLESLKIGDSVDVKGPIGKLIYTANGEFNITLDKKKPPVIKKVQRIGLIAGGTGITPILQLIRRVLTNTDDKTELWLVFANQTVDDILLRDELEKFQLERPSQFHLHYTLSTAPTGWTYSTGHINAEMLAQHLPPPSSDTMVLMCGPPPMVKMACIPALDSLGYSEDSRFAY